MCLNFTGSVDNRINEEPKCQFKCHIFEANAEDQAFGGTKKRSGGPGWVWKRTQLTRSWLTSSIYCWGIFIFHHCWLCNARFIPDPLLARPQEVLPLNVSTAFLSQVTQVSLPGHISLLVENGDLKYQLLPLAGCGKPNHLNRCWEGFKYTPTLVSNTASEVHKIQHLQWTIQHLRIYVQDQYSNHFQEAVCQFSNRRTICSMLDMYTDADGVHCRCSTCSFWPYLCIFSESLRMQMKLSSPTGVVKGSIANNPGKITTGHDKIS